ncbi:MAG: hypothetical protein ACRD5M_13860 [Candidatus Acidiferrales bacterium]
MSSRIRSLALVCALTMLAAAAAIAAPKDRYLHIKVDGAAKGESVNVNVPLSMAEKILPTINRGNLHEGHVTISNADMNGVDVRGLLDAIRTTPDGEFVTVKQHDQDVRVAKMNGNLVVHVRDAGKENQIVDITVPMKVVDALFSAAKKDELDIAAALHALAETGDTLLVSVQDVTQHVRIWVDSRASQE